METGKFIDAGSSGEWGWHASETALQCLRKFAYKYRMGSSTGGGGASGVSGPRAIGSLVHQGLAHYYMRKKIREAGGDPDEYLPPAIAVERAAKNMNASEAVLNEALTTIHEYTDSYRYEKITVLDVEKVFSTDIEGARFTQRLDLIVREADGLVWIYDHKTTSVIMGTTPTRYTLSGQFIGMQMFGFETWGKEFGGVRLNLIQHGLKRGQRKFTRIMLDPAPEARRSFPLTVLQSRRAVERLDAGGLPPSDWPMTLSEHSCMTAYGECDYFDRCRWGSP